jgi:hypothetical protein
MPDAKLILSKKGFDSAYGKGPSPILRDGRMIPFPIPEPRSGVSAATYGSICHDGQSYVDLLSRFGYTVSANAPAHLDPDLISESRTRRNGWRGMLGQVDQAESHLLNEGVGPGSVFLFWGWFERESLSGSFPRDEGFSAIFGYLEVDYVVRVGIDNIPSYAPYHPHFSSGYPRQRNRVYVARQRLSWNPSKPGWGVFNYDKSLRLSVKGKKRRNWRLPGCFHPDSGCVLTYNTDPDKWGKPGKKTTVQVPARGQEYVCRLSGDIETWVHEIIDSTPIWTPRKV